MAGSVLSALGGLLGGAASLLRHWGVLGTVHRKLVLLGLDNAGKTTLLRVLGGDHKLAQAMPTQKPTAEVFYLTDRLWFTMHDLGGHEIAQRLWHEYATQVDAIMFLVDAADTQRLAEAHAALGGLMESLADDPSVPLVILGNKIDLPGALAEDALAAALGLTPLGRYGKYAAPGTRGVRPVPGVRPVELFMCSVARRQGYDAALQWLAQFMPA